MNYRFVMLAAVLLAGPAGAQQIWRCGNSFSNEPCGRAGQAVVIPGETPAVIAPPLPEAIEAIKAECRSWIKSVPTWKDRDSLRIGDIYRAEALTRDGRRVRAYRVMVNAKNSYGGYEGDRPFVCYADETAAKVVDIYEPGDLR